MHQPPRIRLRTIFLLFFCAAVGLAIGTSQPIGNENRYLTWLYWHYDLLAAPSVAMAIGLVYQSLALRQTSLADSERTGCYRVALTFAAAWRAAVAAVLAGCLIAMLLFSRGILQLPETEQFFTSDYVFPYTLWITCVVLVLCASVLWWRRAHAGSRCASWRTITVWFAGVLLAAFVLPNLALIHHLVHIATQGIEVSQPLKHQRLDAFPDHQAEGFRDFWLAVAAATAIALAAASMFYAIHCDGADGVRRRLAIAVFGVLLIAAGTYCYWYYGGELRRISPDLASVGLAASWLELLGGVAILLIFITAAAYRISANWDNSTTIPPNARSEIESNSLHESPAVMLLLLGAAISYFVLTIGVEMYRNLPMMPVSASDILPFIRNASWNIAQMGLYVFQDPVALLVLAMGALSLQLCWLRWRRRAEMVEWTIPAIDRTRFVQNWCLLALLALVGVPTLSSFSFVFWLGPWYHYGP